MKKSVQLLSIILFVTFVFSQERGSAQPAAVEECQTFHDITSRGVGNVVPVIPDEFIDVGKAKWKATLPCLVDVLRRLSPSLETQNGKFSPADRAKFLSAAAALGKVMAGLSAIDKKEKKSERMREFVAAFRAVDDLNVATVLTYGAKTEDPQVQSNAAVILWSVTDNTTVCVVIDHLYDPDISAVARDDLLVAASVVAPWAYAENFDNICRIANYYGEIADKSPDMAETHKIVTNIHRRLNNQDKTTNQSVWLKTYAPACYDYKIKFANRQGAERIIYRQERPSPPLPNCPAKH